MSQIHIYLRRENMRMQVHSDTDATDYQTILEHVAAGLAPHLPSRVSAVVVCEDGAVRYVCEEERERYNVPVLASLPPKAQERMQNILRHHHLQPTRQPSAYWPGDRDMLPPLELRPLTLSPRQRNPITMPSIYLFAEPSSDSDSETPSALYLQLTPEVMDRIESVRKKVQALTNAGMTVYGLDVLEWGVKSHSILPDKLDDALDLGNGAGCLVTKLPEIGEEGPPLGINAPGLRVDEDGVKLIAWDKYTDSRMSTAMMEHDELRRAWAQLGKQAPALRTDLMPYPEGSTWNDIFPLEGVMPVVKLTERLYIGTTLNIKARAALILEHDDADYDFEMEKVLAEVVQGTPLHRLCRAILGYTLDLNPADLSTISAFAAQQPGVCAELEVLLTTG